MINALRPLQYRYSKRHRRLCDLANADGAWTAGALEDAIAELFGDDVEIDQDTRPGVVLARVTAPRWRWLWRRRIADELGFLILRRMPLGVSLEVRTR